MNNTNKKLWLLAGIKVSGGILARDSGPDEPDPAEYPRLSAEGQEIQADLGGLSGLYGQGFTFDQDFEKRFEKETFEAIDTSQLSYMRRLGGMLKRMPGDKISKDYTRRAAEQQFGLAGDQMQSFFDDKAQEAKDKQLPLVQDLDAMAHRQAGAQLSAFNQATMQNMQNAAQYGTKESNLYGGLANAAGKLAAGYQYWQDSKQFSNPWNSTNQGWQTGNTPNVNAGVDSWNSMVESSNSWAQYSPETTYGSNFSGGS
jgi:hypothetical protein